MRTVTALCLALIAGCTTTVVRFEEPPGTTMTLGGKTYTWPAEVQFVRPAEPPDVSVQYFTMVVPTADGDLPAKGEIHLYGYFPKPVDKYTTNTCRIDAEHIEKLHAGYAVTVDGFSAGGDRIYQMILGRDQ